MVTKKILIIDHDKDACSSIQKTLSKKGYKTDTALTSTKGINKLKKSKKYDLVIVELFMPRMDGVEICKKIKKLIPDVPVVLITTIKPMISKKQAEFIRAGGKVHYLYKPLLIGEIVGVVQTILGEV